MRTSTKRPMKHRTNKLVVPLFPCYMSSVLAKISTILNNENNHAHFEKLTNTVADHHGRENTVPAFYSVVMGLNPASDLPCFHTLFITFHSSKPHSTKSHFSRL